MNRSIRLRIAFAVFTVVVSLVALQIVYVLSRFERSFREEVDDRLEELVDDLALVLGSDRLDAWIAQTTGGRRHEDEVFIEVLDAHDHVVAKSHNAPARRSSSRPRNTRCSSTWRATRARWSRAP